MVRDQGERKGWRKQAEEAERKQRGSREEAGRKQGERKG